MVEHCSQCARLVAAMPPPAPSAGTSGVDWNEVERTLSIQLPDDYRWYVDTYGCGSIAQYLWVFTPHALTKWLDLSEARRFLRRLDELAAHSERIPYPRFPDSGGLFPIGKTENGDVLYWQTLGAPDSWPIILNEARAPRWEEFRGGLVAFLADYVSGALRSEILVAAETFESPARFTPHG